MKKLVLSTLCILLLAGCTGATSKQVSKTCNVSINGLDSELVLEGEGKQLTNMKAEFSMPESMMGIEASEITDDQKKLLEDMLGEKLAKSLGLDKKDLSFKFSDDALNITMDIDFKNMSDEMKTQFGFKNTTDFNATIKDLENNGATCK